MLYFCVIIFSSLFKIMSYPHIETDIDSLVEYIFVKNKNDAIIELTLGGIEDNKDLFYFCLDLFCKGLVILFGDDRKSVIVNTINMDQFAIIKKKMHNAGIDVTLDIVTECNDIMNEDYSNDKDYPPDIPVASIYPKINVSIANNTQDLNNNDLLLKDYKFDIHLTEMLLYRISFNLFHRV